MSLLQTIKASNLEARKAKYTSVVNVLTPLIGEAEMVGKNAGREVTDQEVVAMIKKFIKNLDETIRLLGDNDPRTLDANGELNTLNHFLPKQLTEAELKIAIEHIIVDRTIAHGQEKPKMGLIMQDLKTLHDSMYDGKLASQLIKEALV